MQEVYVHQRRTIALLPRHAFLCVIAKVMYNVWTTMTAVVYGRQGLQRRVHALDRVSV